MRLGAGSTDIVGELPRWILGRAWLCLVFGLASSACGFLFILAYPTHTDSPDPAPFRFAFGLFALVFAVMAVDFFRTAARIRRRKESS